MDLLRKLLLPFSVLWGFVLWIRNALYDAQILKSTSFDIPVIAIGNLSVGGTGKSPQTEYLIRLLQNHHSVGILSRGYKRKTSGFLLADEHATAQSIGDEPYQFYRKFPGITVAVDANRTRGIQKLLSMPLAPDVILLDDAYQHRKVKAGFYILLTRFDSLYCDDVLLPAGNLREGVSGAKRADVIVVTKCPAALTDADRERIAKKLGPRPHQHLFFSRIVYDDWIYSRNSKIAVADIRNEPKVLVAGIAQPEPFFEYLASPATVRLEFADHRDFSASDLRRIRRESRGKRLIATEKDYVRLAPHFGPDDLFYLPIKTEFLTEKDLFDKTITDYVGASTRNR